MVISSEMKDDMFIRTIGANLFDSDFEDGENDSEDDLLESEFEFSCEDKTICDVLKTKTVTIQHKTCTSRDLVGLQVWRGAFLLADFILHNAARFNGKNVIELASGVGLTSIVAGLIANKVLATDVDRENILSLLRSNVNKNNHRKNIKVAEFDFFWDEYSQSLTEEIETSDIILAADVVYIEAVTKHFIKTLLNILKLGNKNKEVYIAVEKRREASPGGQIIAPMFSYFHQCLHQDLHKTVINDRSTVIVEELQIDFPQYFVYTRVPELTLWKIHIKNL
eukprot:TRINITY_DN3916_c0_g1_i10.p1 TRINITY_DN3916_c0_g1~~TRINITY_DN3916_c0_g1_i10.p1  ORF type:complete len:280 (+),score=26.82 TRINITY_DN3916_c0_g1_i10:39-878(+)